MYQFYFINILQEFTDPWQCATFYIITLHIFTCNKASSDYRSGIRYTRKVLNLRISKLNNYGQIFVCRKQCIHIIITSYGECVHKQTRTITLYGIAKF